MSEGKYTTLEGFLRCKPPLSSVRLDNDDSRIVRITARQYRTAEAAIRALDPGVIEGLAGDGNVLRVWRLKKDEAIATVDGGKITSEPWPSGETAELGQVITAACDRAASRHENAWRYAFDKLEALYKGASARLEQLERDYFGVMTAQVDALREENAQLARDLEATQAQLTEASQNQAQPSDQLAATVLQAGVQGLLGAGPKASPSNGAMKTP